MLALWFDLENRWNAWHFYLAFRPTSPMSWGAWILLVTFPVGVLFALHPRSPALAWAELASGLALALYTGVLLGVQTARPLWNSPLLPLLFLASGLSGAAALLLLVDRGGARGRLWVRADLLFLVAEILLLGLYVLGLASGPAAGRSAVALLLGGVYTPVFWGLVVVGGLLVPLVAEALAARQETHGGWFPAVLVLAGGFLLRWVLVAAGQAGGLAGGP
jgi:formate-dependent nitrite reductase membrane component NrfD